MTFFVHNSRDPSSKGSKMSTKEEDLKTFRRIEDWERLAVLEVRVNDHESDLKQVFIHQELLSNGIAGINKTLQKILWVIVGAVTILLFQKYGALETIGMFIK